MTFALWSLGVLALLYALDLLGVWLWLLDRVMRRIGKPAINVLDPSLHVRRSGRFCRLIAKLPSAVMPAAITIGRTIVLNEDTRLTKRLLQHEAVHIRQYERWKLFGFLGRYCYQNLRYGYTHNAIEAEANAAEEP